MKEFFSAFNKAFTAGLEPEPDMNNVQYLTKCHNVRASEFGLKPHETVTFPLSSAPAQAAWPFPQYVPSLTGEKLCFYQTAIYNDQTSIASDITPGGAWHVAEFPGMWFGVNGSVLVCRVPWQVNPVKFTAFGANSVCAASNALIFGGLQGSVLSSSDMIELFGLWKAATGEVTNDSMVLNDGAVWYWQMGGGASDRPFAAELAACGSGVYSDFKGILADAIADGRMGFCRVDVGKVLCVKPLGTNVVVYGSERIVRLDSVYGTDGVTRFQVKPVLALGIGGRGHVAGDGAVHCFVDTTGCMWLLTAETSQRLGYRAYFAPLVANEATIPLLAAYDPEEGEAWFSAGTQSFCLRGGSILSSRDGAYSWLTRRNGQLQGYVFGSVSQAFEVITSRLDLKQRGIKSITNTEVSVQAVTGLQAALQFRYAGEAAWRDSDWIDINDDGAAYPMITAQDFRLKIKGTLGANGRIDYAYLRWKLTGQRSIRGLYGQAG